MPDDSLSAHGADLGKPRVSLDRQPPPLVVGQMPMKRIDLVQRKDVEIAFHLLHGAKMAANVEHHAPVGEKRFVLDPKRGDRRFLLSGAAGGDLSQGLHGMKRPAGRSGREVDALSGDLDAILLRGKFPVESDVDGAFLRLPANHVGFEGDDLFELTGENPGGREQFGDCDPQGERFRKTELLAVRDLHEERPGDDVDLLCGSAANGRQQNGSGCKNGFLHLIGCCLSVVRKAISSSPNAWCSYTLFHAL